MVVEDFASFREYIHSKLANKQELNVICELSDGLEAVAKAQELRPELILLDISLPSLNGIEVAHRICSLVPEAKIIFLSQETSADFIEKAVSLGAWGYVFKTHAENDLLRAIDAVLSGKRFISGT
jgi:DNA-binding NarL/FixJ family response regulator